MATQSPRTFIPMSDPALQVFEPTVILPPQGFGTANVTVVEQDQRSYTEYKVTNVTNAPGGTAAEVQFNTGTSFGGDSGLTYDAATDSLTVTGVVYAGEVWTDTLNYANGDPWTGGTGTSGYSGYSGINGDPGTSGYSGYSGTAGGGAVFYTAGIVSQYFQGGEPFLQPDLTLGTVIEYTVDASFDLNMSGMTPGQTVILLFTQDATGGWVMSTFNMLFPGGVAALSVAPFALDQLTILYTGSTYIATLVKDYK